MAVDVIDISYENDCYTYKIRLKNNKVLKIILGTTSSYFIFDTLTIKLLENNILIKGTKSVLNSFIANKRRKFAYDAFHFYLRYFKLTHIHKHLRLTLKEKLKAVDDFDVIVKTMYTNNYSKLAKQKIIKNNSYIYEFNFDV
jgi:hypothetical protein